METEEQDPLSHPCPDRFELQQILPEHKAVFDQFFTACPTRLSDYSFANTFIWRDSIHLRWRILRDCLCVFANGDGGLTLLFPPLGPGDFSGALREALAICEDYNLAARFEGFTRVEYVSRDLLERFPGGFDVRPMSGDYVYATARMIDLAGGDLASKRQARNRFARRHEVRTEPFGPQHVEPCLRLLGTWHRQTEDTHAASSPSVLIRRGKEEAATAEALRYAGQIGLTGMVLYAGADLVGFTFGEMLDEAACSIVIEKTDRNYTGSAQYIFSEFCRQHWAGTTWCNVGDDWDVPSLAWTKQSYRPAYRIPKWLLRPMPKPAFTVPAVPPVRQVAPPAAGEVPAIAAGRAGLGDLEELAGLEERCFPKSLAFSRRRLRYLLRSPRADTHVIRRAGRIVADAIILRPRTPRDATGRLYSLAVDEGFRGQGLAQALLRRCLEELQGEKAAAVVLEVAVENAPAIGLYEKMGFRRMGRIADYYGPGQDAWKMRREMEAEPGRTLHSSAPSTAETVISSRAGNSPVCP